MSEPSPSPPLRMRSRDEHPWGSRATLGGVGLAAALMAGSLILLTVRGDAGPTILHHPVEQARSFLHLDPTAWASVGCMILAITPIVRAALLAAWCARVRRWPIALAAFAVLAVLVGSIAAAWHPLSGSP